MDLARQLGFRLLIAAILDSRSELHLKRSELGTASKDFHVTLTGFDGAREAGSSAVLPLRLYGVLRLPRWRETTVGGKSVLQLL